MILGVIKRAIKLDRLISLIATYLLGAGLVQFVREMRSWTVFIQGGFFLFLMALSLEYMRLLAEMKDARSWPKGIKFIEVKQTRLSIVVIITTLLTIATSIFVSWMVSGYLWQGLITLMLALIFVGGLYYFSFTAKIIRPFQILIEALLFVIFPPAIAFFLQSDSSHRLLTLVVLGLVPAYLAYRMLIFLKDFSIDSRYENPSIVTRIGWQKAMTFHNAMILLTYLLFALTAVLGFPWFLLWPVFLSLPIGLLEIWLMERVRQGGKPLWLGMQIATACVFLIPVYLVGFAFWIR